ncbi:acetyltransferase [Megalodesulfovibrio gigas]|uniref:Putative pilin glycosylation protein PglB n=1 Tax=Megalodesulfovibrio gigas (strain ATCC 19364 / DSM 1382 / NCIMB 9332 / VKM B-1759) TaxID=1121448 RepID=T2GAL8_MEGG1|nr:acetyltransferase [Megalodesulfovibrio gigas]AGW12962.1 putative pilin glycosylation protein PglB [Megalodesulfovibrio gigas DSM 1382 = ATCC 19364]
MNLPMCYILGAGGHGRVVLETAQACGAFKACLFLDGNATLHGTQIMGALVLGGEDALPPPGPEVAVLPALGDNHRRLALTLDLLSQGYTVPTVVHPRAWVSPHATLGAGTVVFAMAVVQPGAILGCSCIVNTAASVDHDCVLGDGVHCSPGVRLAGGVQVGDCTHLGIGSCVIQEMRVGEQCVVGAGAAVVKDIPPDSLALGVPAVVVRKLPPRDVG